MTSGGYTLDEVKRMHGLDRPRLNSYLPPCKSAACVNFVRDILSEPPLPRSNYKNTPAEAGAVKPLTEEQVAFLRARLDEEEVWKTSTDNWKRLFATIYSLTTERDALKAELEQARRDVDAITAGGEDELWHQVYAALGLFDDPGKPPYDGLIERAERLRREAAQAKSEGFALGIEAAAERLNECDLHGAAAYVRTLKPTGEK